MSSAVDIQIVSTPNLQKIENFFKDASYRETIEFSANFNTRLCLERRLRLPFFDPQTRIAQNHSQLFMDKRLRMPGFKQGQIYTYPAARWRKSRRQYLNRVYRFPDRPFQGFRKEQESLAAAQSAAAASAFPGTSSPTVIPNATMSTDTNEFNSALLEESSSLGAGGGDTSDSKDSQQQSQQATQKSTQPKDDMSKEWFYDDMDMNDVDSLEDPKSPADDEYDYDPRYGSKKRRKRRAGAGAGGGKRSTMNSGEGMLGGIGGSGGSGGGSGGGRRRSGAGRGRNSLNTSLANLTAVSADGVDGGASNSATSLAGAGADVNSTPTSSGASGGRRQRGTGTRGRRRTKKGDSGNSCDPPSPGLASEPPSFESAAAAVGVSGELSMPDNDLRNYRKYLL